jgi:pimeloyl-ACP methyl ester carboxylesterase
MKRTQRLKIAFIKTKFKLTALLSKKRAAQQLFTLFCTPYAKSKRTHAPNGAQAVEFIFNGAKVKGYRWNHSQQQKVLILHGFSSAAHKFDSYVQPLVNKGYEVLSFDAPAHGSSPGKTCNAVEYAAMIKQVMETFGPVNSFMAHSFGGIAVSLALETIPHSTSNKIVLIAPATETTTAINSIFKMLDINNHAVRMELDNLIDSISGHPTSWFSIRRAVKNINAKILWLHDEDDDTTPLSDALKVKEDNNEHIQFVITKGLGHRRIYHDAAVKKAVIAFL